LPATVILAPRVADRGPVLGLRISNRDAHALVHELAGRVTLRRESLQFAARLAGSLGCTLEAVHLHSIARGVIRASVQCTHAGHPIDIPAEPCQCLTLAIVNDLPILFDGTIEHALDETGLNRLVNVEHAAGF
jgi:bifunctional DNase/RNase